MLGSGTSATTPSEKPANQPPQAVTTPEAVEIAPVDLKFDTNSAAIEGNARSALMTLAQWAKCTPRGALILEGHADIRGSQDYNMKLASERAAAVREKLIKMGVPASRIVVTVYGENGPHRGSLSADRRVTVRASARPVPANDITAQR